MNTEVEFPIKNNSPTSVIPPFSVVRVVGFDETTGSLVVDAPDTANASGLVVTGEGSILGGGFGKGSFANKVIVQYDTADAPAFGDTFGSVAGSYSLKKGGTGFAYLGGEFMGVMNAVRGGGISGTVWERFSIPWANLTVPALLPTWSNTGTTTSIPSAGEYLVTGYTSGHGRISSFGAGQPARILTRLYNATTAARIPGTGCCVVNVASVNTDYWASSPFTFVLQLAAAAVVNLQVTADPNPTWTVCQLTNNDTLNEMNSHLAWVKLQ